MNAKTDTQTHTLQVNFFTVDVEREMTNAEIADYFRGIAKMFDEQASREDGYGLVDCIISLSVNGK